MLEAAAAKAMEIEALKEAVNQLSLAINHGKTHPNKALWIAMIGLARYSFGELDESVELAYRALEVLGDPDFMPQTRSSTTIEMMVREYATLDDLPPRNNSDVDSMARAKMLICLLRSS